MNDSKMPPMIRRTVYSPSGEASTSRIAGTCHRYSEYDNAPTQHSQRMLSVQLSNEEDSVTTHAMMAADAKADGRQADGGIPLTEVDRVEQPPAREHHAGPSGEPQYQRTPRRRRPLNEPRGKGGAEKQLVQARIRAEVDARSVHLRGNERDPPHPDGHDDAKDRDDQAGAVTAGQREG